ncbi:UNKNOWN [Stylonychia lemnae]|uniref:Cadg domain containing protein n=1 Tax=Stylonychia lemnae TaxID=5949 RepID=A0A078AFL5_STYLE|nr:UNKNOWN [Stylonychia lemnae]|eukprot:CDW80626.1 UNKNOWN [Stylonychia lemnae]
MSPYFETSELLYQMKLAIQLLFLPQSSQQLYTTLEIPKKNLALTDEANDNSIANYSTLTLTITIKGSLLNGLYNTTNFDIQFIDLCSQAILSQDVQKKEQPIKYFINQRNQFLEIDDITSTMSSSKCGNFIYSIINVTDNNGQILNESIFQFTTNSQIGVFTNDEKNVNLSPLRLFVSARQSRYTSQTITLIYQFDMKMSCDYDQIIAPSLNNTYYYDISDYPLVIDNIIFQQLYPNYCPKIDQIYCQNYDTQTSCNDNIFKDKLKDETLQIETQNTGYAGEYKLIIWAQVSRSGLKNSTFINVLLTNKCKTNKILLENAPSSLIEYDISFGKEKNTVQLNWTKSENLCPHPINYQLWDISSDSEVHPDSEVFLINQQTGQVQISTIQQSKVKLYTLKIVGQIEDNFNSTSF